MLNTDRPVVFVVPGDLHLTDAAQENYRVAEWVVEQINTVVRPDFVQFIGDNVQDARPEQFALFNALRARLTVPHDVLVGDHDVHEDPHAIGFRQYVGSTYGARTFPGLRCLRLNTQQAKPLGLSFEQLAWFRNQVDEAQAAGEQILVFQHNYPYQIWEDYAGPGVEEWRAIVQTRRITALICGHTHYWQIANDGRNVAVAVRSIGDPEGGRPGYLVGYARGRDMAFVYRTQEDCGPIILITHPRAAPLATGSRHVVRGAGEVRAWIRSTCPIANVRWRVDHQEWLPLRMGQEEWMSELNVENLSKGVHLLEVEAQDAQGQIGQQSQPFVVDSTGRYNPIPGVWPVVAQTLFC